MTLVREIEDIPVFDELPEAPPRPVRRSRRGRVALELVLLAAIAALTQARGVWAAQALLVVLVLTVPGLLALRALRVPGEAVVRFPVYVPCASLVVLLAAGLAVDLAGPARGLAAPLRTAPLLAGLEAACLLLLATGAWARREADVPWAALRPRLARAWPLVLPLAAAAGAALLTNGHGPAVAVAAMGASVATLFVAVLLAGRTSGPQLWLVLYGVGLAAAWSFSLRGHFLYGFDINGEYHVFASTLANGVWRTPHHDDAYGAMLSLTVLPSLLTAVTGIAPLAVFKVVYPAIFALFPPGLYGLASRFLDRRYALVAAGFVVVQSYFFQQLPAIARQEIGLLLFLGLVAAIVDDRLPRGAQCRLAAALGVSMVVAHYSTTYLAAAVLGLAIVLQLVVARFRPLPRVSAGLVAAFVAVVAGGGVWYGAVTHSTANLGRFTSDIRERGLAVLPNAQAGQGLLSRYLSGNAPARIDAQRYEQLAARDDAEHRPYVHPLHAADEPAFRLVDVTERADAIRGRAPYEALRTGQVVAGQLLNALALLGALALALRRRTPPPLRRLALLGAATLGVLALVRLSGTAGNAYNQERAFVQTMVPLGIAMGWVLQVAARVRFLSGAVAAFAALALVAIFASTSGLRGVAFGGGTPANLTARGDDYERFYVTAPELAAARWLQAAPRGALVYADRYGQLRILAATGRSEGVLLDVTPRTLDRHAWVYASRANSVNGVARGAIGNRFATYRWPAIVPAHYATVYTNGSSSVYHRP